MLDEALVLFNNLTGETIGYFNLTTANLYEDGEKYDLLKAGELSDAKTNELKTTIELWTYWGEGSNSDPAASYLGMVEGALALFALNASTAGLDTSKPIYTSNWIGNGLKWFDVSAETHTNDGTNFNNTLVTINAAEKAEAMTKL